jgi:hypothetical protein
MLNLHVADKVSLGQQGLILDCVGKGNIWIEEDYGVQSLNLARELILKSLLGTTPGQLEVIVFDYSLRGVASPFSTLQDVGALKTLISEQDLLEYFDFLKSHIQGVNNVMQGRERNLIEFRKSINQSIESYKLVVLTADLYVIEDKLKETLSILLAAGPPAGVNFLIVSAADDELAFLRDKCQFVKSDRIHSVVNNDNVLQSCQNLVNQIIKTAIDPVNFDEIESLREKWTRSSIDGLTFALGKYGAELMQVTLGNQREQRHNALITGAVGQGKSNVIAVIIHSLCQRYSPDELELYLLDFKEGVSLQTYSNIGQDAWLVHAKALGLESDVAFGLSVLEYLFGLYEERMALFKRNGVQGIKEYRELAEEVLPRILLVVDEFQVLFEEREAAKKSAVMLSKCMRLFRAAGIHIILASQTIANGLELSKDSDIFAQTPIRIALKNSVRESEATLGSGNIAASDLRMGQAIVNLDYGALSSNRKVAVAYADPEFLRTLRQTWWEATRTKLPPPYVFDGKRPVRIASAVDHLISLRNKESASTEVALGETISVNGRPLYIKLSRESGRNIALIGAGAKESFTREDTNEGQDNIAVGMVQGAGISLALQNAKGNAQFIMCNLLDESLSQINNMHLFVSQIQRLGFLVEILTRQEFCNRLDEIADSLHTRTENDDDIFIMGLAFDRLGAMPPSFEQICRDGSVNGVHIIGWWQKMDRFEDHVGFGNSSYFDVKVMLRVDARDVQRSLGLYEAWENKDNRALVADTAYLEHPISIIPILPVTPEDVQLMNRKVIQ